MNARNALELLPVAVRLPLLAGLIVFAAAIGTTQIALTVENREADRQTERLARVYLDGLAASIGDDAGRGDWAAVERRFHAAFDAQEGVREVTLHVLDRAGRSLARAAIERGAAPIEDFKKIGRPIAVDQGVGTLWASRPLGGDPGYVLVAALDIAPILDARRRLFWGIVAFDLLVAAACALLAYLILRRINRTTDGLLALIQAAGRGATARLSSAAVARADRRTAPILAAYNEMVDAMVERESLREEIARRTQTAALGRLAATMAHEVRNPLGGLATAVATLRKFGDKPEARTESLDFLARGIETIDAIVARILNLHRPEDERRLTPADFEDLRLLLAPAAAKRALRLDWRVELPERLALGATGVRQVLLNLLLNACAASPPQGKVTFAARVEDDALVCEIADEGPGMQDARIRQLVGEAGAHASGARLGLDAVVALLGDLDGAAHVERGRDGGTVVRLRVPLGSD
ncbi:MAG: HAMP domain-containing histidine kinase [Tagaea sp.]|nr:HAMP domain-containing histidine kinase [Tagaea sp.]